MKSTLISGVTVKLPHKCTKCNEELNDDGSNFPTRIIKNKLYFRPLCRKCFNQYTRDKREQRSGWEALCARRKASRSVSRATNAASHVLADCKSWDKRHGFICDLNVDYVQSLIDSGCGYCGCLKQEVRISMDRINNDLGHTKDNVVPSCIRCNLTRSNMPYQAWLVVASGMRTARETGLFGGWVPGNKRKSTPNQV